MYLKKGHKSFFYKSNNRTMSSYYKFYTIVSEKVNLLLIMHKQKVKKTLQWYVYLCCRHFLLLLFLFYWAFLFAHYNSPFANSIATVSMKRFWLPWRTPTKEYIYISELLISNFNRNFFHRNNFHRNGCMNLLYFCSYDKCLQAHQHFIYCCLPERKN